METKTGQGHQRSEGYVLHGVKIGREGLYMCGTKMDGWMDGWMDGVLLCFCSKFLRVRDKAAKQ